MYVEHEHEADVYVKWAWNPSTRLTRMSNGRGRIWDFSKVLYLIRKPDSRLARETILDHKTISQILVYKV